MKAERGQNFLDLVIQGTGNLENAFEMSLKNGISITDDLETNQEVTASGKINKSVVANFNKNNKPATALSFEQANIVDPDYGIGEMTIESTFKVR